MTPASKIRTALIILVLASSGCSRLPFFRTYSDPHGEFELKVPVAWPRSDDADLSRKPVSKVSFMGKVLFTDEGLPVGAGLSLSKIVRNEADDPNGAKSYPYLKARTLAPTDELFGAPPATMPDGMRQPKPSNLQSLEVSGLPARLFVVEGLSFPRVHRNETVAKKAEFLVIQTPRAYYELQYYAPPDLFEKYHFAFEKAKATLRIQPSAG